MVIAILLSLAASFCTATASVCQRLGARSLDAREPGVTGFDLMLVFRLARRPVWLLGFACMIGGFAFQVSALHFGPLALVQPLLVVELLIVFSYLAVLSRCRGVRRREWLAALAMSAGLSVFLRAASPSGGQPHAPGPLWWISGLATLGVVAAAIVAAGPGWPAGAGWPGKPGWSVGAGWSGKQSHSPVRRAALLGVATGVAWGFVAAVIKELSSRLDGGLPAVFGNWSAYVLMGAGAAAMLLASHAMTAGPLAASQPGFTLLDPVVAILLGVFLFGEHLQATPAALTAEVLGLLVLAAGVWALSHSDLISSHAAASAPGEPRRDRSPAELMKKSR